MMNDFADRLNYRSIQSLSDPSYDSWLDIYQTSFPLTEQMLVSSLNSALREIEGHDASERTAEFLLAETEEGEAVGISHYVYSEDCKAALLWYIAVRKDIRSKGFGSQIYHESVRRLKNDHPEIIALMFEVEDPTHTDTEEENQFAHRRIAFYRRCEAKLVGGIHYLQSVGWQPPIPMNLMIQPLNDAFAITAENALELIRCAFGSEVEQISEITLE